MYSYLYPQGIPFSVSDGHQWTRSCPTQHSLHILRASHQLNNEISKYFYDNCIPVVTVNISHCYAPSISAYPKKIDLHHRYLPFKKVELRIVLNAGRDRSSFLAPGFVLKLLLAIFREVKTIVISLVGPETQWAETQEVFAFLMYCKAIPDSIELLWDFSHWDYPEGKQQVAEAMEKRGGLKLGQSIG